MISVCIITKNEQRNISACILSVKSIADEIIVADTGSSDQTIALAHVLGARTASIPWTDDFAAARNECLDLASHEWVLFIDADERLVDGAALRKALHSAPAQTGGFYLIRRDTYLHHKTFKRGKIPTLIVRAFRRRSGIRYEGIVHEVVAPAIVRANLQIELAQHAFLDHAIDRQSPDHVLNKQRHYLALIDRALESGENAWLTYQKAKTHWFLNQGDIAIPLFQSLAQNAVAEFRPACLNNLASIHISQGECAEAGHLLKRSLALQPRAAATSLLLGDVLLKQDRPREALRHYSSLSSNSRRYARGVFVPMAGFVYPAYKYHRMAMCLSAAGFLKRQLLRLALHHEQDHPDTLMELVRFYKSRNDQVRAGRFLRSLVAVNPEWTALREHAESLSA